MRRRALAGLLLGAAALLLATAVASSPVALAADHHCRHKPWCPPSPSPGLTPPPVDQTEAPATPPVAAAPTSQVQAAAVPTPYDDASATPGPAVGTLLTPRPVLDVPAAAPTVLAHPQGDSGLAALLIAGAVLAFVTLLSVTVAIALR